LGAGVKNFFMFCSPRALAGGRFCCLCGMFGCGAALEGDCGRGWVPRCRFSSANWRKPTWCQHVSKQLLVALHLWPGLHGGQRPCLHIASRVFFAPVAQRSGHGDTRAAGGGEGPAYSVQAAP
jgi:hypothetical protein